MMNANFQEQAAGIVRDKAHRCEVCNPMLTTAIAKALEGARGEVVSGVAETETRAHNYDYLRDTFDLREGGVEPFIANILTLADTESCSDLQAGVVAFWDWVDVLQALTFNQTDVTNALNSIFAGGGANWPEASDEAMRELATASACLNLGDFSPADWRADCCKVAILVTDATPGGCDDNYVTGVDNVAAHQAALNLAGIDVKVGSLYALTEGFADPITQAIMQDYAVTTGGVYGEIPADGSGTAAAIEQIILECTGSSSETELCCLDGICFTVLEGQCEPLGGEIVPDCDDCAHVPTEEMSWSTVKTLF